MPRHARNAFIATVFLFTGLVVSPALAKVVGTMMVAKGKVWVIDQKGERKKGRVGYRIEDKDTVITEKDARAKLVMLDKNVINISPESQVNLEKYEFDPKNGKKDVLLNVLYGKVRSNVQQKYDGKDSKFQVKTKAAVAGVRGTDFLSGYNPASQQSQFVTFQGMVEVGLPGANGRILNPVQVAPGQFTTTNVGGTPEPPRQMSRKALADMNSDTLASPESNERTPSNDDQQGPRGEEGSDKPDGQEGDQQDTGKAEPGREDGGEQPKGEGAADNGGGPNGDNPPSGSGEGPKGDKMAGGGEPSMGDSEGGGRGPAATGPGGMVEAGDLPSAPTGGPMGPLAGPGGPLPPLLPPQCPTCNLPPPPPRLDEICPTCKDLQQGKTRLIIDIINK